MHVLILILGSMLLLLPKAYTLKCYQCVGGGGPCSPQECPASSECGAVRITSYVGGAKRRGITSRDCVPSAACISSSINYGAGDRMVVNTKCCSTDLCNKEDVPEPSAFSPNGKKCYGCTTADKCNTTANCTGDEDRCMSVSVMLQDEKMTMKACVTQSVCSAAETALPEMAAAMRGEVTCCTGDLCNSARSTGVGLLLLMAPIVSVALLL